MDISSTIVAMRLIFDKEKIVFNRTNKTSAFDPASQVVSMIAERLDYVLTKNFQKAILAGCELVSELHQLLSKEKVCQWEIIDLSVGMLDNKHMSNNVQTMAMHVDELTKLKPCDLIVSLLNMHIMERPDLFLHNVYKALNPDGMFIGALWGGDTLSELRHALYRAEIDLYGRAYQRVMTYMHPKMVSAMLQMSNFHMPTVDIVRYQVVYESVRDILEHMRRAGEMDILNGSTEIPNEVIERTELIYDHGQASVGGHSDCKELSYNIKDTKGGVQAQFDVLFITAWKSVRKHA